MALNTSDLVVNSLQFIVHVLAAAVAAESVWLLIYFFAKKCERYIACKPSIERKKQKAEEQNPRPFVNVNMFYRTAARQISAPSICNLTPAEYVEYSNIIPIFYVI